MNGQAERCRGATRSERPAQSPEQDDTPDGQSVRIQTDASARRQRDQRRPDFQLGMRLPQRAMTSNRNPGEETPDWASDHPALRESTADRRRVCSSSGRSPSVAGSKVADGSGSVDEKLPSFGLGDRDPASGQTRPVISPTIFFQNVFERGISTLQRPVFIYTSAKIAYAGGAKLAAFVFVERGRFWHKYGASFTAISAIL